MFRVYTFEGFLFIMHRVTGGFLLTYLVLHVLTIGSLLLGGESLFEAAVTIIEQPFFLLTELIVVGCLIFHAGNGVRLILGELGFQFGSDATWSRATMGMTLCVWVLSLTFIVFG